MYDKLHPSSAHPPAVDVGGRRDLDPTSGNAGKISHSLQNRKAAGRGKGNRRGVLITRHGRSRTPKYSRPSHPRNAGTEHVEVSLTRQTSLAPSTNRREVFGESHD